MTLARIGDLKTQAGPFLFVYAALFAAYLASLGFARGREEGGLGPSLRLILVGAVVFRLIMLFTIPTLSDDINRYIWEGGIQLEGINPYRYSPSDPALEHLRDDIYEGINHKDLPTIYPPVMQWAFAAGALLGRSPVAMKVPFVAADVVLMLILVGLLRARGLRPERVMVYAWNPLVVIETAGSGHNDTLALCFLAAATLEITRGRRVLSMTALGLSALCKLFPMALLPLFSSRVRARHLLLPPLLMAACYLPYLTAGANLFRSTREYAERWRFNDSVFSVLASAIDRSGVSPVVKGWADTNGVPSLYAQPPMLARGLVLLIAAGVLLALILRQERDGGNPVRSIFLFTGVVLILQPTLHPWYLLWVLPWMVIHPSAAWIALSGLVALSYLDAWWVRWAEYVPFFALLAAAPLLRRRSSHVVEFASAGEE